MTAALSKTNAKWSKHYDHDRVDFSIAESRGFIVVPRRHDNGRPIPWVWYAPTLIGQCPGKCTEWISRRLLANGIAVCGVDVGESYGNPRGRAIYTEFYEFLRENCGFSNQACLWPQSRGGLMLCNWSAEHPEAVKCVAGTYTVCDISSWPGLDKACGAYGMTERSRWTDGADRSPRQRPRRNPRVFREPTVCGLPHRSGQTDILNLRKWMVVTS